MIRASPCDYYLRYLLTHPDNYRVEQIRRLVKLQQLDFLGMPHLERLRERCAAPVPFYPENLTHHPSQRFLVKERIQYLWHLDDDSICATKLLDHPRGKEIAETMLLSDGAPLWICGMLKKVGFKATPRAIELFKHYYFNVDLLDRTEIRAIIDMRASIEAEKGDVDSAQYKSAYWKASKDDSRRLSTVMGLNPMTGVMNMMRMGLMPSGVDVARIATVGRMAAVIQSAAASITGKSKSAMDYALTAKMLTEMMDSVGDASGDFQQSLMRMNLATDSSVVPSIEQLTDGNYTVDVIPKTTANDELDLSEDGDDGVPV